jgi:DNA-binding transcriptional LysR family regulator
MVDFRALETLIWVVTLRSFRAAAEKLNTTQPAISQRIAALERDVGHKLVNRINRNITPTTVGRRLLDHAERLISARADMLAELADPSVVRGSLSLGVNETIVHTWLPVLMERIARTHPGIDLDIDVDISFNLRDRVIAQDIDLAFMLGPVASPALQSCDLCRFPLAFLAAPSIPFDMVEPDLAAIARHPILTFARNSLPYQAIRQIFASPALPKARIRASSSLATIVRMTLHGIGVAVIPPAIVGKELAEGRLVRLDVPVELPDLLCVAAWREGPNSLMVQAAARIASDVAAEWVNHRSGRHGGTSKLPS